MGATVPPQHAWHRGEQGQPPAHSAERSPGERALIESGTNQEVLSLLLTALPVPYAPPCLNSNDTGGSETSRKEILIKA